MDSQADDPKQYIRDPATGSMVEGRWVCPSCKFVNGAVPRCGYLPCGYDREGVKKPLPKVDEDTWEFEPLPPKEPS